MIYSINNRSKHAIINNVTYDFQFQARQAVDIIEDIVIHQKLLHRTYPLLELQKKCPNLALLIIMALTQEEDFHQGHQQKGGLLL